MSGLVAHVQDARIDTGQYGDLLYLRGLALPPSLVPIRNDDYPLVVFIGTNASDGGVFPQCNRIAGKL